MELGNILRTGQIDYSPVYFMRYFVLFLNTFCYHKFRILSWRMLYHFWSLLCQQNEFIPSCREFALPSIQPLFPLTFVFKPAVFIIHFESVKHVIVHCSSVKFHSPQFPYVVTWRKITWVSAVPSIPLYLYDLVRNFNVSSWITKFTLQFSLTV